MPTQDALFEAPRTARVFLKEFQVVIGFEQENLGEANPFDDEFGGMAEIGEKTDVAAVGA